ncbi:MAG TPA: TlpA disulfide reductase family protein [Candidatus Tumulicola sp.]
MRPILAAAGLTLCLAASPATPPQPSNPAELAQMLGKSATGMTFVPLDGPARPWVALGRPTVVIAFASWCEPCIQEMPRTVAEYAKYRDRVTFLGIDYTDPPAVARKLIARFAIAFPVESYVPSGAKPPETSTKRIILPSTITEAGILSLKGRLPDDQYQKIQNVYRARSTMTADQFQAYERWMGVYFKDPKEIAAARAASKTAMLGLPHTFVIDRHGIVAGVLEGYDPSTDRVAHALERLGVK